MAKPHANPAFTNLFFEIKYKVSTKKKIIIDSKCMLPTPSIMSKGFKKNQLDRVVFDVNLFIKRVEKISDKNRKILKIPADQRGLTVKVESQKKN